MNRIYQGRVSAVEVANPDKAAAKTEPCIARPDWENVLWKHHELFQDAVNYYIVALVSLGTSAGRKLTRLRGLLETVWIVAETIHVIRGQRVMLDGDLAALYEVAPMVFNQAIRRNADRFPKDFVFQLTREEVVNLKSQIVISSSAPRQTIFEGHGGSRKLPFVFTEHGAIMAATILRSPRAVAMSVYVVRAFVQMRDALLTNSTILKRLAQIDKKLLEHDLVLQDVVEKLLPLLNPPDENPEPKRRIGFHEDDGGAA